MATAITIMGGTGQDTINFAFTVTGTNTTAYTQAFANAVNAIIQAPGGVTTPLDPTAPLTGALPPPSGGAVPVYVLDAPTVGGSNSYAVGANAYAVDSLSAAVSVTLAGADSILVGGINAAATVTGAASNNEVIFVTGTNEFLGTADSGGDTIVAGSGRDTIFTSYIGNSYVYSGTGEASITLQDTAAAYTETSPGTFVLNPTNDFVYLQDGSNTVNAFGANDVVFATSQGQTIYGNETVDTAPGGSFLGVVLLPNSDGTVNGNDIVNGSATGTVAVFDFSSNNSITGGSGSLDFIGGSNISASLSIGAGNTYAFGAAGDSVSMTTLAGDTPGYGYFVAGAGNETLNGAGATSNLYLFGGTDTAGGDSFSGGSALNLFTAGAGSDTFQGGSGTNVFNIDHDGSANANILLTDFATDGTVTGNLVLDGFTTADVNALYNDTTTVGGNLVATIGDSTTITFTGITSGSALEGHVYTFT
jgi:hypothetical protein